MTIDIDWCDPSYLLQGNERQRKAYTVLTELDIFNQLKRYDPILVGTIPLAIDIPGSDLDVICEVYDLDEYEDGLKRKFGHMSEFDCWHTFRQMPSVVASFQADEFAIEIFGQGQPTRQQNAYRHMVIEARILSLGNELLRGEIRRLKAAGLKTEPAFAEILSLSGDPYDQLLALEMRSNADLRDMLPSEFVE